jgi:AcrR family transcriptional regulator
VSPREDRSQATRAALIKAARELFARKGYADTATEEIVRRAKVTRGALYHHFRDKVDLFRAVYEEIESEISTRVVEEAARAGGDTLAQLQAGCEAFLDACRDPAVRRIAMTDGPAVLGWDLWREIDAKYGLGLIKAGLGAAMDAGTIERRPIDPLAHLVLGALVEGGMVIAHANDGDAAREEIGASLGRLLAGLAR